MPTHNDLDDDQDHTTVARRPSLNAALAQQARKPRPWLVIVSGAGSAGRMYRLDHELVVGRSPSAGVYLNEEGVSRKHAKLVLTPEGTAQIVDLDSRNGTFVNGERVARHTLRDGDKIQVGGATILKFSYQDAVDEELQKNLYESATRDAMTQIANKKTFTEALVRELSFASRHGRPLSLALFDVDHFKRINDTHGHPAGDHVLRTLATAVGSVLRAEDIFARVGGEEFAVVLRDIPAASALAWAERVRATVERTEFVFEGKRIPVTISIGVSVRSDGETTSPDELVASADRSLYGAKQGGRNRVCMTPSRVGPTPRQTSSGRDAESIRA